MEILTAEEVLAAIKQYSRTREGQKEIQRHMTRKRPFVPRYYDKTAVFRTIKQMYRAARDMGDILYRHIITDTVTTGVDANGNTYQRVGLSKFNREDIVVHHPVGWYNGEYYTCNVGIYVSALHRDSLIPNNDGIEDIISLFVHGYTNAKRSVHGEWHGMEIWTPRSKAANPAFLQNAIEEFNRKYKGKAVATIKDEYNTSETSLSGFVPTTEPLQRLLQRQWNPNGEI